MPRLKDHPEVGAAFLDHPHATTLTHDFAVPAQQLWQSLLDAEAWTHWLPLTKVIWTSPEPFGVGTTRTVEIGAQQIDETFFAWEDGRHMAFWFNRSSLPVRAVAEDYVVEPTDSGSRLIWTFRFDAAFPIRPIMRYKLSADGRKGLVKLDALIRSDPERFTPKA